MDLQLETPRLVLRPLALGDVGTLRPLVIDPRRRSRYCAVYPPSITAAVPVIPAARSETRNTA